MDLEAKVGTFLVVQWLRLLCSQCRVSSLVRELDPTTSTEKKKKKIPRATAKIQSSQINKYFFQKKKKNKKEK